MTLNKPLWTPWSAADARAWIRLPTDQDHKYTRGVLGVVTGSRQYPGAAVLGCAAALATGLGMVRFYPAPLVPVWLPWSCSAAPKLWWCLDK